MQLYAFSQCEKEQKWESYFYISDVVFLHMLTGRSANMELKTWNIPKSAVSLHLCSASAPPDRTLEKLQTVSGVHSWLPATGGLKTQ